MIEFILAHAHKAHWFILVATLLAGLNIPISIDLMVLLSAFLAATSAPENLPYLFGCCFLGCYFAAWIAYGMGRKWGLKLRRWRWFASLLNDTRLERMKLFYEKYGFLTLLVGRFIPFGVRNGIFLSSGMSKLPFKQFILWDFLACLIWSSASFYLFYRLAEHHEAIYSYLKALHLWIFSAFSVAVISFVWYKRKKRKSPLPQAGDFPQE